MTRTKPGKLLAALLAILMLVSLTVPALAETAPDEAEPETLKIAVLSDIHYMSPTMIADTEDFTTALNSDRKLLTESAGISDYMLDLVRKDKPDILLISTLQRTASRSATRRLPIISSSFRRTSPD